ncbi:tRNA (adenine-N1)-methyltransferase [Candidatus Woesearchaeota archaeon CG_4_10_14_0_8_um_filter_47_5]|nr:MAG: tRNA (adenine-N1)-methyltransferase [Candidatus Woesearchaeota archaeon CG_4_10_14_0_8_um_filter_47_5]
MLQKILVSKEGKFFYLKDISQDYHTQYGFIAKGDLAAAKPGTTIVTNTGKEFILLEPGFIDSYKKIRRGAQIIHPKDIALIIAETGISKSSCVVDAGAGSGALALFLANLVKEVTTYEIREDFANVVRKNVEFLGLKNVTLVEQSIYEPIPKKNIDLMTLDVPEPWCAIPTAKACLKTGGFLVSYSPCIPQVMDFVEALENPEHETGFLHLKTVELIERSWEVTRRKVRPKSIPVGHTGFLTFARKLSG